MSKKLVIRINNLQDLEKNDSYEVIEETAIRWDRVIGVAIFILLLVIATIVGLTTVLNSHTTDNVEASVGAVLAEYPNEEPENIVSDTAAVISEQKIMPAPAVVVEEVIAEDVVVGNIESIEPKPSPLPVKPKLVEQTPPQLVFRDPIDIKSEKIVRAQLTNRVSKREPVDKLGSTIPMNDQGLIKVFLFTDMHGLKGETLYHEWYLAGKRMARVKINVRNNNVSASSSKFIDKYMMGDWKVNVVNHRGDSLVSAQFVVAP